MVKGGGRQYFGDRRLTLEPGDLDFLPARSWHIADGGLEAVALVLNFYDNSLSQDLPGDRDARLVVEALARRSFAAGPRLELTASSRDDILERLTTMSETCERGTDLGTQCAIKADLMAILARLATDPVLGLARYVHRRSDFNRERLERVLAHIDGHLDKRLSVADLAGVAGVSPSHFHVIFRQHVGVTVVAYLRQVRVERATELLRTTTLSIKEVAARCGFPCLSHFYAVFRECTGRTPGAF